MSASVLSLLALVTFVACSRATNGERADQAPPAPERSMPPALTGPSSSPPSPPRAPALAPPPKGFVQHASFPLAKAKHGVNGTLELLVDERLRFAELSGGGREVLGGDPCRPLAGREKPRFCEGLQGALQSALLRLSPDDARTPSKLSAGRPLVHVACVSLVAGSEQFQVTEDRSTELGSYSGRVTRFAEIAGGALRWIRASDAPAEFERELSLMSSLKTAWRFEPSKRGENRDLLEVACRPRFNGSDDAGVELSLELRRYTFDQGAWRRYLRREPGCWERGDAFPERARFP